MRCMSKRARVREQLQDHGCLPGWYARGHISAVEVLQSYVEQDKVPAKEDSAGWVGLISWTSARQNCAGFE